ncbi:unnamed protein product [Acanthoscelides obtectus]|uniref:Uncharacterized protein n=1 Tax=Acanthoscelides obtectus TaxID=200917 RepID=A0A9P0PLN3_ACAOB|nr:unnamed protein product [Acanthoscelides obtectus]CAK1632741.1 hypothetical protein AOBTE_LOCUS7710 [Acanthoscelides obtectus]
MPLRARTDAIEGVTFAIESRTDAIEGGVTFAIESRTDAIEGLVTLVNTTSPTWYNLGRERLVLNFKYCSILLCSRRLAVSFRIFVTSRVVSISSSGYLSLSNQVLSS